jgi:hypothetical protein
MQEHAATAVFTDNAATPERATIAFTPGCSKIHQTLNNS